MSATPSVGCQLLHLAQQLLSGERKGGLKESPLVEPEAVGLLWYVADVHSGGGFQQGVGVRAAPWNRIGVVVVKGGCMGG